MLVVSSTQLLASRSPTSLLPLIIISLCCSCLKFASFGGSSQYGLVQTQSFYAAQVPQDQSTAHGLGWATQPHTCPKPPPMPPKTQLKTAAECRRGGKGGLHAEA